MRASSPQAAKMAALPEGNVRPALASLPPGPGIVSLKYLIDFDEETCRLFGKERSRLRQAGSLPGDMDLLIGATALRHGLTMLTNNSHHFRRIAGLRIESLASE